MYRLVKVMIQRKGNPKKVSEHYLVDAIFPTEAETKFNEYIKTHAYSELNIGDVVVQKVDKIINESADLDAPLWFKVTINAVTKKERKKSKKYGGGVVVYDKTTAMTAFVKAEDMKDVNGIVEKFAKENINCDSFTFGTITETKIMDLIR